MPLVAIGLVVAVVGGGLAWWNSRGPSRPSIGQAVNRFRSDAASGKGAATLQPAPGVYIYAGTGEEKLSFLATHQSEDGLLPATVRRGSNGCWTFGIEYNSFHRQTWRYCEVDHRLVEQGNTVDQKFDFGALSQSEHTATVCRPAITLTDPTSRRGDRQPVRCVGRSQTTKTTSSQRGVLTFVGPSAITVGGSRVPALHFSQNLTLTGGQKGSQHEELWIAATNGLPLREQRRITVVSSAPAPLNEVTYSEQGTWTLTSMKRRT